MSQGFKWTTSLTNEEMWLNSDREILNRATQSAGKTGIILTLTLPNGEDVGIEVDKLNAENGATFCNMQREYYNEWKAGKEAASRRKQRDREQQSILDSEGSVVSRDIPEGAVPVQETVQALETAVQGAASLEEEVLQRIAAAEELMQQKIAQSDLLDIELAELAQELEQMNKMKEIFNASKVLEQASTSVPEDDSGSEAGLDSPAHSPSAEEGSSGAVERGDTEA